MSTKVWVGYPRGRARGILAGLSWSLLSPIALVAIGKLVGPTGGGPPSWLGYAVAALMASGALIGTLGYRRNRDRPAELTIEAEDLVLVGNGRDRRIPVARIESGMVVDDRDHERLELRLEGGEELVLTFVDRGAANAALEQLGLDVARRRARVPIGGAADRVVGIASGAVLGGLVWAPLAGLGSSVFPSSFVGSTLGAVVAIATLVPFVLGGGRLFARLQPELVIGADGISWRGLAHLETRSGFVPFGRVSDVAAVLCNVPRMRLQRGWDVGLALADGQMMSLAFFGEQQAAEAQALVQRIRSAMELSSGADPSTSGLARLERGAASISAWLVALRELAHENADYRKSALTPERLVELVEDASAAPRHRVAAAVVLSARDPQARERIRVAAAASASPRVRIALESVAAGEAEEEAITAALSADDELEAQPRQTA